MERKRELNYMNAIACLFVILIHVLSLGISSAERTSWQAAVIYFPWRLSAFVVPMFLYTGAVKMARQFMDREVTMKEYGQYFLHRIQKIYIPYVLWTVLYYLSFMKIDFVRGNLKEFLSYLLIGNLASPFFTLFNVYKYPLFYIFPFSCFPFHADVSTFPWLPCHLLYASLIYLYPILHVPVSLI